jgi:glutamine amidotransferase-like uncharacterized protein
MSYKPIALFADKEAVFYSDLARVFEAMDARFGCVEKSALVGSKLSNYSALVIPGGYTLELLENLNEGIRQSIRGFVREGGGFIGVCMGAYLAGELGLVRSRLIRVAGEYDIELNITKPQHPVMRGYAGMVKMNYQNGPEMIVEGSDVDLASFPNGRAAIAASCFGNGRVVIFSPHPERSRSNWKMIMNALEYCGKMLAQ